MRGPEESYLLLSLFRCRLLCLSERVFPANRGLHFSPYRRVSRISKVILWNTLEHGLDLEAKCKASQTPQLNNNLPRVRLKLVRRRQGDLLDGCDLGVAAAEV